MVYVVTIGTIAMGVFPTMSMAKESIALSYLQIPEILSETPHTVEYDNDVKIQEVIPSAQAGRLF
jgi:hypothetical protein